MKDEVQKLYEEGKSIRDIADELSMSVSGVYRHLKKMGIPIRNKSEAQTLNLEKNGHPMTGTTRSDETKQKISKELSTIWKNNEDLVNKARQKSKERWDNLSVEEKRNLSELGLRAIRETAKTGSKLERFIANIITDAGFFIEQHQKILMNDNLEVDIYIPTLNVAVEVDGPSHFIPVWGEEKLLLQQKADDEKFGLLKFNGIKLIRIKNLNKKNSLYSMTEISNTLVQLLKDTESLPMFTQIEME